MRKKWNAGLLMTAVTLAFALAMFYSTGLAGYGTKPVPGEVRASEAGQLKKETQSLGDFRKSVALSIGQVTGHISKVIVGSAGGKLPPALTGKGEGTSDKSKTSSTTESRTAPGSSNIKKEYDPYNVYDYDSADDFAEDYVYEFAEEYYDDEFEEDAYDDAYDDACEYWEGKHRK